MRSALGSNRGCLLVDKLFSRSSLLSGTGPVGSSGVSGTVEVETLITGVMEAEEELVEGVGTVHPAADMEKNCGCDVLLCSGSAGKVVFMMELVLLISAGLGDSYSVGG